MNWNDKAAEFVSKLSPKEREAVHKAWEIASDTFPIVYAALRPVKKCENMDKIVEMLNQSDEEEQ